MSSHLFQFSGEATVGSIGGIIHFVDEDCGCAGFEYECEVLRSHDVTTQALGRPSSARIEEESVEGGIPHVAVVLDATWILGCRLSEVI